MNATLVHLNSAFAGNFPSRSITVINPYLPGGVVEVVSRPFLDALSRELNVGVNLRMMPGAGSTIGTNEWLRSRPDGYHLLINSVTIFSFHPHLKRVPYVTDDGKNLVVGLWEMATGFCVHADNDKYKTFEEFISYAKSNPGTVNVGTTGINGTHHAWVALIEDAFDFKVQLIPFDGAIAVTNAIVNKHIDAGLTEALQNPGLLPLVMVGRRSSYYPEVRSLEDMGRPDLIMPIIFSLYAHPETPPKNFEILEKAARKAAENEQFLKVLDNIKYTPSTAPREDLIDFLHRSENIVKDLISKNIMIPDK